MRWASLTTPVWSPPSEPPGRQWMKEQAVLCILSPQCSSLVSQGPEFHQLEFISLTRVKQGLAKC